MPSTTRSRYEEIAEAAGFRLCTEIECAGKVEEDVVHMPRVRVTTAGMRFLMAMCYETAVRDETGDRRHKLGTWEELWDRRNYMLALAKRSKVKLPAYVWAIDKARVRENIARARRRGDKVTSEMKQAEAWARR